MPFFRKTSTRLTNIVSIDDYLSVNPAYISTRADKVRSFLNSITGFKTIDVDLREIGIFLTNFDTDCFAVGDIRYIVSGEFMLVVHAITKEKLHCAQGADEIALTLLVCFEKYHKEN